MKRVLWLALVLVLCPVSVRAQDPATGFPPYGSFAPGGFDTINRQNLNVNFAIPKAWTIGRK